MDDIGASTKRYEVYSKFFLGNILFLKYYPPFQAWGPYQEISVQKWKKVFEILCKYNAKLTIGVTASWVEKDGSLTPFPDKFPEQSELLRSASEQGIVEIANHGLTHCVVGRHLPRRFSSNRQFHREFWDWIPRETHFKHMQKSQEIFQDWLGYRATTLIPPGNVFSVDTLEAASSFGIDLINSYINLPVENDNVKIVNDSNIDAFHDREVELYGVEWLEHKIKSYSNREFGLLREIQGR